MSHIIPEQNPHGLSLRDLCSVLFRHKTKALVFFLSVMVIVTIGTFLAPEMYQSQTKILLRLGRESVALDPTATTGQFFHVGQDRESEINTELEILRGWELAEAVVDEIGIEQFLKASSEKPVVMDSLGSRFRHVLKNLFSIPETAIAALLNSPDAPDPSMLKERGRVVMNLMKNLNIESVRKSSVIYITYESESPQLAHDVVDKIIKLYREKHIDVHRTEGSYQFFDDQTQEFSAALAKTEDEIKQLKNKSGIGSLEGQRRILLDHIGSIRSEMEEADSTRNATEAKINALKISLGGIPKMLVQNETTGFADSAEDELRKRIHELQIKEQELLSTFTESSIPISEVRRQIHECQVLLSKANQSRQTTKGINATYQQLETALLTERGNLSSIQAKTEVLHAQLKELNSELLALNELEVHLAQLERRWQIQKTNYEKYSVSLEQARIDRALETEMISNISVAAAPTLPVKPIRPKKRLNLALGLFLGIFGALGLSFLAEYLDHSLRKPEDIERRLQLPSLASIPKLNGRKRNGFALGNTASRLAIEGPDTPVQALNCEMPPEAGKSYIAFLNRLRACPQNGNRIPQVISVTSCYGGEGTSTAAVHIALILARQGKGRILLVDSNFERPSMHRIFGCNRSPGFADILADQNHRKSNMIKSPFPNLDLVCAGKLDHLLPTPSETGVLPDILERWRHEYLYIILDTPPVYESNHTVDIASLTDGVVLVVEAEKSRWEVAQCAKERILLVNTNILGVVLNKRCFHIPEWLYHKL